MRPTAVGYVASGFSRVAVPAAASTIRPGAPHHRPAAELYGLGDLIADTHEFSVPERVQTRRPDVRLYLRQVLPGDRDVVEGLPVMRAHRIVADLLASYEDVAR